jgi:hypothetical protein
MLRPAAVTPAAVDDILLHSESSRLQASSIVTPCSCYAVRLTSRLQASSIGQLILRIVKLADRLLSGGWQAGRLGLFAMALVHRNIYPSASRLRYSSLRQIGLGLSFDVVSLQRH